MSSEEDARGIAAEMEEMFQPMLKELSALLGESPEAWRGAGLVANGLWAFVNDPQLSPPTEPVVSLMNIAGLIYFVSQLPPLRAALKKMLEEQEGRP